MEHIVKPFIVITQFGAYIVHDIHPFDAMAKLRDTLAKQYDCKPEDIRIIMGIDVLNSEDCSKIES